MVWKLEVDLDALDVAGAEILEHDTWAEDPETCVLDHSKESSTDGAAAAARPTTHSTSPAASASPTRQAGRYTVVWRGTDDMLEPIEQGTYAVCIESERQGGTYQLIREEFTFASTPFEAEMEGNSEITGVRLEYRERS